MMKQASLFAACTLLSVFVASNALADGPAVAAPSTTIRITPVPTIKLPTPIRIIPQCADPAATAVDFTMLSRSTTSRFQGRVRITGKVKNLGAQAFESRPGQQSIQLVETPLGGRPRIVATLPFVNLAPNQEISVSFDRSWDASSPAEGEFPPNYKIVLSYDPDIYIDGNTKNDDCVSTNNTRERSSADINAMFR
jgi:hypothetical protein